MLHYRDKRVCVSPLALWSEADLQSFDESAVPICEARGTVLLAGKRPLRHPRLFWRGG